MDNATPIEAISLNFTSENKGALASFDEVINKLKQLQNRLPHVELKVTGGKSLKDIATTANGLNEDGINKLSRLADALEKLSTVSIPHGIASSLRSINKAMNTTGVEGAEKAAEAISNMHDLSQTIKGTWEQSTAQSNLPAALDSIAQSGEKLTEIAPPVASLSEYFSNGSQAAYQLSGGIADITKNLIEMKSASNQIAGLLPANRMGGMLPSNRMGGLLPAVSSADRMRSDRVSEIVKSTDIQQATQQFAALGDQIGRTKVEYDKFAVAPMKMSWSDIFDTALSKARSFFGTMRTGFADVMSYKGGGMPFAKGLVSGMTPFGSAMYKGIGLLGKGMFMPLAKELQYFGKSAMGAASSIGNFFSRFKRIAVLRLMRATIKAIVNGFKEGTNNLYEWSKAFDKTHEFANSMDKIATAILYVKNSLGAMVAPIINALAPALDWLADKFVGLLNIINEFFAALTGAETYTVAKKVATEFKAAADNTGKATKALKSFTIGIDELNIIEDTGSSGSGGGGNSNAVQDWFEKKTVDRNIKDFFDRLKKMFEEGDWNGIGQILGTKANELVDKIPWAKIGTKAGKLFTASFTIGTSFLDTFNATNLGSKVATMINKFFENADFSKAGEFFITALFKGVDFVGGFLDTLDWKQVTGKISDFFIGGMRKAKKWFESKNWKEVGKKLYKNVKEALSGIKIDELVGSFWDLINGVATATIDVVTTFVDEAGTDIGNWFYDLTEGKLPKTQIGFVVGNIGADIIEGLVQLAQKGYIDVGLNVTLKSIDTAMYDIGKKFVTGAAGEENVEKIENSVTGTWWEKMFYATKMSDWYDMFHKTVSDMVDDLYAFSGASEDASTKYRRLLDQFKKKNKALELQYARDEVKKLIKEIDTANPKMKNLKENIFAYMSGETLTPGKLASTVFGNNYSSASEVAGGIIAKGFERSMKKELTTNGASNTVNPIYNVLTSKNSKDKMSSAGKTLGNTVKSGFGTVNFENLGKNVVTGVKKGINDNKELLTKPAKSMAKLLNTTFQQMTDQHSPSRLYAEFGKNLVLGLNMGIANNQSSSVKAVQKWASSLSDTDFSIDNISMPTVSDIVDEVQGYIATTGTMALKSDTENMQRFYTDTVIPIIEGIASDAKRQADKNETTEVYMDSRKVTNSVNKQNKANGYSFVK